MWETVELRELRIFLALAEELHFARTAERLHLSQPRVSQAIRTLEAKTGGPLLHRTSRHVALTPLGELMRAEMGPAYERLRESFETVREGSATITGTLRIGLHTPMNAGRHMVAIVRAFNDRHPDCEVVFLDIGMAEDQLGWLRDGRVDLLATRLPVQRPDITIGPVLSRDRRVLLVSRDDPLSRREAIDYDEIGDRAIPEVRAFPRETMDAYLPPVTASGRRLRRIANETTDESMMRVATGEQVSPSVESWTEHYAHPKVAVVAIRDLPRSETALAWITALRSPRVAAFVSAARSVLAETELADDAPPSEP